MYHPSKPGIRSMPWLAVVALSLTMGQGCPPPVDDGQMDPDGGPGMDAGAGGDMDSGDSDANTASDWPELARLTAFDPGGDDLYGDAVAATDSMVVVGTEQKDNLAGVVDVFVRFAGEWRFLERLERGPARFPQQSFGSAVAVSNRHVFVGAQKFDIEGSFNIQHGGVYVFENVGPGLVQSQILTINDGQDFENLGGALAYEPNQSRLIAGAQGRASSRGAAYVFSFDGSDFSREARLLASDGGSFDRFGTSVAMAGTTAVVGAPNQNSGLGAVYIFERSVNQWSETQKIVAPDGAQTDQFGAAVAISGNTLVISAPAKMRPQDTLLSAGYVYIYTRSNGLWMLEQTLIPTDADAGLFGSSVAARNGIIAVGIEGKGKVLIYEQTNGQWTNTATIDTNGENVDSFGEALAIAEDLLVVGARSANANNQRAAGAAYIFAPPGANDGPNIPGGVRF